MNPSRYPVVDHASRRRAWHLLAAVWFVLAVIGTASPIAQPARALAGIAPVLYDLAADEVLGGHTIARHVGKTDRELADRLRREPQISAASTYTDLVTARRVVAAALASSQARIRAWTAASGMRPNLVVSYTEPGSRPIGRSLRRGTRVPTTASRATVVLRWLSRDRRWIVLTSYPEVR
ncbi:MAG: RNase A-like domain-containing protein [Vicinamibacterales bacterium]